jgi:hypothetical protein
MNKDNQMMIIRIRRAALVVDVVKTQIHRQRRNGRNGVGMENKRLRRDYGQVCCST